MKLLPLAFALSLALFDTCSAQQAAAPQPTAIMPVAPAYLLKLLPPAPVGWKLATSRAFNSLDHDPISVQTYAVRTYAAPQPTPAASQGSPPPPAAAPAPPMVTTLQLVDTGLKQSFFTFFNRPAPGARDPYNRTTVAGFPAVSVKLSDTKQTVIVNVSNRFVLSFTLENEPPKAFDLWAKYINFALLEQAAQAAPKDPIPPHQVPITRIDEVDAAQGGSTDETYMTPAEQAAFQKDIQEEIKRLADPRNHPL